MAFLLPIPGVFRLSVFLIEGGMDMTFHFNFAQEWPILILIGLFVGFVVYLAVIGRRNQDKDQDTKKK